MIKSNIFKLKTTQQSVSPKTARQEAILNQIELIMFYCSDLVIGLSTAKSTNYVFIK